MSELARLIREFRRGRCRVQDFFIHVCPHVTSSNVKEICEEIPRESFLGFRRCVAYQRPFGRIYRTGTGQTETLDENFFRGLAVLREHLGGQGTLQFGDYLFMQRNEQQLFLSSLERSTVGVTEATLKAAREELYLIDSLLKFYPPETLADYAR